MMKSQILGFDVLKIILALFVVAIHCWVKDSNYYLYQLCQIAVPCFFVISGFLLEKQSEGNEYNKKYLKKIIRLYSIWVLIYFPFSLYQLFSSGKPYSESIYWYIRNVFISGDFYQGWQLWYLLALIQVSIVLMILKKSFPGGHVWVMLAVCLIVIGISSYCQDNPLVKNCMNLVEKLYPNGRYVFLTGFVFMTLGALIAKYKIYRNYAGFSFFMLVVSSVLYVYNVHFSIYLFSFSLVNFVALSKTYDKKMGEIALNLRNLSTLIYLVHMIPLGIADIFWSHQMNFISLYTYGCLTSLILSIFILRLSNHSRFIWLKNIW